MSETIDDVRNVVRLFLHTHCAAVPSKKVTSKKEHLEVWTTRQINRVIGLEMKRVEIVNIWVTTTNVPRDLPASVLIAKKAPRGREWTDENGDGANSNLSSYDAFRTQPVTRLGISCVADAQLILNYLIR